MRGRIALLAAVVAALTGCGARSDVTVVRLAHGLDPSHPVHRAMEFMAERLAEKSAGRMRLDLYPSQQLGSERELLELLQLGSIGMTKVTAAVLEGFVPKYKALSAPYVFRDEGHRFRVLEGEIGRELLEEGRRYWLLGLAFYDAGSRSFYTKDRPIHTPDDLRGLRIRTLESATQIRMVNELGGSATPISWGELYTALQQGVVDGAENNPPSFQTSRHYEVCRYYSLDEHTGIPDVLLVSTIVWDRLSPEEQGWLAEAAAESAEVQKRLWREATEEALRIVQEAGVTVLRPDKTPFLEKAAPLLDAYRDEPEVHELIERIRAVE